MSNPIIVIKRRNGILTVLQGPDEHSEHVFPTVSPKDIPSAWPKGQNVLDRLYWLTAAELSTYDIFPKTPFDQIVLARQCRRIEGLTAQAFGLL